MAIGVVRPFAQIMFVGLGSLRDNDRFALMARIPAEVFLAHEYLQMIRISGLLIQQRRIYNFSCVDKRLAAKSSQ